MGYYSELAICLTKEAQEKLDLAIENNQESKQFLADADSTSEHTEGAVLYYWEFIKWYEYFPVIKQIMDFINSLDSEDYFYLRIGEALEDVEEQGAYFDNPFDISITREITVNGYSGVEPH